MEISVITFVYTVAGCQTAPFTEKIVFVSIAATITKLFASFIILVKVISWNTGLAGSRVRLTKTIPTGFIALPLGLEIVFVAFAASVSKLFANSIIFVKVISRNPGSTGSSIWLTVAENRSRSNNLLFASSPRSNLFATYEKVRLWPSTKTQ